MANPHLQIRRRGGGGRHPDTEIREGGPKQTKNFCSPSNGTPEDTEVTQMPQ